MAESAFPGTHWARHGGGALEAALAPRGDKKAEPAARLLDARWLCALARSGGRIERREALPPEAFVRVEVCSPGPIPPHG